MMKLLLVMFSVISPFSVQPAAVPAAQDMQWTVVEEEVPEITLAADRSGPVRHFQTLNGISLDDSKGHIISEKGQPLHKRQIHIWVVPNMSLLTSRLDSVRIPERFSISTLMEPRSA